MPSSRVVSAAAFRSDAARLRHTFTENVIPTARGKRALRRTEAVHATATRGDRLIVVRSGPCRGLRSTGCSRRKMGGPT